MKSPAVDVAREEAMALLDRVNGCHGQWWSTAPRFARSQALRRAQRAVLLLDEAQELIESIPAPSAAVPKVAEPVPVKKQATKPAKGKMK